MKFQIGDRVVCVVAGGGEGEGFSNPARGMAGTVVAITPSERIGWAFGQEQSIGVCFDQEFGSGHILDGSAPNKHGWWCSEDALELVEGTADADIVVDLEEVL